MIGVAILALALAGGAAFGLTNSVGKARDAALKADNPAPISNTNAKTTTGYPECAKKAGLPVPKGMKPISGTELSSPTEYCSADLSSSLRVAEVVARYQQALREANWKFQVIGPTGTEGRVVALSAPKCGTLAVARPKGEKTTTIRVFVSDQYCQATRFSPAPTPSRSN